MADRHPFEDDATLYVLGQLGPAERRRFEGELDKSPELRALVRELEDGAVAAAMSVPQQTPPSQAWRRIEEVVNAETKRTAEARSFWFVFWRNGWAAAAACLAGWMLYALWIHQRASSGPMPPNVAGTIPANETSPGNSSHEDRTVTFSPSLSASNNASPSIVQTSLARTGEIASLRRQVTDLQGEVNQLSRTLKQTQALLAEPGRFTLFQLTPPNVTGGTGVVVAPPSADVQRAFFFAIAREMGWQKAGKDDPAKVENPGVDFVDLGSSGSSSTHQTPPPHTDVGDSAASTNLQAQSGITVADAGATSGSIPGFVYNTNAYFAIGSSSIPSGGAFTVWMGAGNLGTYTIGNNPLVLGMPLSGFMGSDGSLLNINFMSGGTNLGSWAPGGVIH